MGELEVLFEGSKGALTGEFPVAELDGYAGAVVGVYNTERLTEELLAAEELLKGAVPTEVNKVDGMEDVAVVVVSGSIDDDGNPVDAVADVISTDKDPVPVVIEPWLFNVHGVLLGSIVVAVTKLVKRVTLEANEPVPVGPIIDVELPVAA